MTSRVFSVLNLDTCLRHLYIGLILKGMDRWHKAPHAKILSYSNLSAYTFGVLGDHLVIVKLLIKQAKPIIRHNCSSF
jgi:hypothetical protein